MRPDLGSVGESIWLSARRAGFAGSDPYDALSSCFLSRATSGSRLARAAAIQLVKRSRIDLRPILGIRPGLNPKALALFLASIPDRPELPGSSEESQRLQDILLSLSSDPGGSPALSPERAPAPGLAARIASDQGPGLPGSIGWGYDFPWQGRAFYQPAYSPTAVVTSFVVEAFESSGSPAAGYVSTAAGRFVSSSLRRHESPEGICFSYSPRDSTRVYNASLLAARTLVRSSRHDAAAAGGYRQEAASACRYVVSRQQPDGSWRYGDGPEWCWIDGFHTGFVIQCLCEIADDLRTDEWRAAVVRGLDFYRRQLFDEEGTARTAPGREYPLDPHSFAQGAITFLAAGGIVQDGADFAHRIVQRAVDLLWDGGRQGFLHSRGRLFADRTIHMRWDQAWMLRALCALWKSEARS